MNHLLINRLFSQNTLKDMTRKQESSVLNKCVVKYSNNSHWENNQEALSFMYKFAAKKYRNEYFYKNTLLNKLLIGRHSLNTTTALTEFNIGNSKADFILINGKAVVYEIKTELDNLDRLDSQISDYYKAFDHVCIVTSDKHFNKIYEKYGNTSVGICVLTDRETISTKKECMENRQNLDYEILFKVLRKHEFEEIIFQHYGFLPATNQFVYYKECFKLFEKIEINNLYEDILVLLKQRVRLANTKKFLNEIPYELKSLIYFSNYNEFEYEKLLNFLKSEIKEEE
ncbi:sce7726 family protein [Enterococcus faecalis]|uniref:sce7726 family protein n=1 Tax=Enterococcus faecalis TaxID=1351 RepID=UPI00177A874F|nr:sce7726 family protein [Enterococcus faecalis]MBD9892285.1 sce7726 family protein [Enterococcus faecalis]MBW4168720.1 sce7726 family protein [Enterococcus faecalis]MBW4173701.1 sce7726 family protein [Enterococcus faecalis]MBW4176590.1 sce7726 family protein [Enterococcus faecalis]MCD4999907.1 sce7726 family protein [Enterococcus faecalis]